MTEPKDNHGWIITRQEDLQKICYEFYKNLYQHKEISEEALDEVFENFPGMILQATNETLMKDITERKLVTTVISLAKENVPGHDEIPVEVFSKLWHIIGHNFYKMILRGIEKGILHEWMTKGLISLIPKKGNAKDLNHWRPITLLTTAYKIFAKTLQLRLQPVLREIISPEQTIFLPLRFIPDKIGLTQETIHWAKTSK